jgi:tetratricopeptide (TPR) repeat protein
LIDAETGAHVWADRFGTALTNLAQAQSEITSRPARTLKVELLQSAGRQIAEEKNPDARDLIMRGWAWYYRPISRINRQEAQQAFEQALKRDPGSVGARVGIADVLVANTAFGWSKSRDQDKARAQQLLVEALERDDDNGSAHIVMGVLRRYQNRRNESQIELERGLALDRNNTGAMQALGWTLITLGRPEAAIPYFQKALRLDPHSPFLFLFYTGLGSCHLLLGQVDEAIGAVQRARAANPRIYYIWELLAAALGLRGDTDGAKAALAEFLKLKPELNSLAKLRAASPEYYSNPRLIALAEKTFDVGLRRAGLPDK